MNKIVATFCILFLTVPAWSMKGINLLPGGNALKPWQPAKGWQEVGSVTLDPDDPKKLKGEPGTGIILSQGRARYLMTKMQFRDVEVYLEFLVPKNSNSGVYFCGSHEVQILDSFGVEKPNYPGNACGGIYPEWVKGANVRGHNPKVNAALPPGEWQSFQVMYRAPRFDADGKKISNARFEKVVHNDKVVHENVEILGTTRSGLPEKALGPLRLQGDHGPVAYRNIRYVELKASE